MLEHSQIQLLQQDTPLPELSHEQHWMCSRIADEREKLQYDSSWEKGVINGREAVLQAPRSVQEQCGRCSWHATEAPWSSGEALRGAGCLQQPVDTALCSHERCCSAVVEGTGGRSCSLWGVAGLGQEGWGNCWPWRPVWSSAWTVGPVIQSRLGAVLGGLQPIGSPLRINSEQMASIEARVEKDHGGVSEMEHYGVTAAPTLCSTAQLGGRGRRGSGWIGRFTVSSHCSNLLLRGSKFN